MMKSPISSFLCAFIAALVFSSDSLAEPAGQGLQVWRFRSFQMKEGQPSAVLISSSTGSEVSLHAGDTLEGYQLLTVNPDRLMFRKGEEITSLLYEPDNAPPELNYRVGHLQATRMNARDLLEKICRESRHRLVVVGEIQGTLSVDFSDMTVKEILDSVCTQLGLTYHSGKGTIWVMLQKKEKEQAGL